MNNEYTCYIIKRDEEKSKYLAHHGIAGQKWGQTNGPPYPLDYNDHSASEKKGNYRSKYYTDDKSKPLKKLTGNKKEDYKRVKNAYKEAKYATAASKEIERQRAKAAKKNQSEKEKSLSELEKLSKKEANKRQKELKEMGAEFASLYGDRKIKNLSSDSLSDMSTSKAKRYIYNKGHETTAALLLGGGKSLVTSSLIKRSRNKDEFDAYKSSLKGDTSGAEAARRSAGRKNLVLQGYVGYTAAKAYNDAKQRQRDRRESRNSN